VNVEVLCDFQVYKFYFFHRQVRPFATGSRLISTRLPASIKAKSKIPVACPLAINVLKISMDMIFDFGVVGLKSL